LNDVQKFDVYIIGPINSQINNILKKIKYSAINKKIIISLFDNKLKIKKNKNLNLINL
jgi:hypothetical protein